MQKEIDIAVIPERKSDLNFFKKQIATQWKIPENRIQSIKILKRSIDARAKQVVYRLKLLVGIDEPLPLIHWTKLYPKVNHADVVIIIGAGPAGLFAALQCIEQGIKPIVLERGKNVQARRRDLAAINRQGVVNSNSNYCFGEGGAGTYSDGKLYTRSNKRGDVQKVLQILVAHGAVDDILMDARPHIGTNKLPHIIESIRHTIEEAGGEIRFNCLVTDIETSFGAVQAVVTAEGDRLTASRVILATGHSARDVFELFAQKQWALEAKPFALGVRIEHPQTVIDATQYHCEVRSPYLPPAYYSLVEQVQNHGVFSFCMCPGGIIAPCATEDDEIVVNGWSPSKRNNPFANSGTVVQVGLNDLSPSFDIENPLALLYFQKQIERTAFLMGGGRQVAPAQRMVDFVQGKLSMDLPVNSYLPGTKSTDLTEVLPSFIVHALKSALPRFGEKMKGYFTNEAVLVGVESRTSSPVRIPRDKQSLQHLQIQGLYPCGEGAGYAGGIVSAAIDGMNCALAIAKTIDA